MYDECVRAVTGAARMGCLALAAGLPFLASCSVNGVGAVAAHVQRGGGATVVDTYSGGAMLRTETDDAGFGLGVRRRTEIFAPGAGVAPAPGWYFLHVPAPADKVLAFDERMLGLDVTASAPQLGVTLGLRALTVFAAPGGDDALDFRLRYDSEYRIRTTLVQYQGGPACSLP